LSAEISRTNGSYNSRIDNIRRKSFELRRDETNYTIFYPEGSRRSLLKKTLQKTLKYLF